CNRGSGPGGDSLYTSATCPLFFEAWYLWIWWSCSTGRVYAPRPCRAASVDTRVRLQRRPRSCPTCSWPSGCTTGDLHWVCPLSYSWFDIGWTCFRLALILHGRSTRLGLYALWGAPLDASRILRCWSQRDWYYRL